MKTDKTELNLFDELDKIRCADITSYNITVFIKELSNNFDIDLLISLANDIEGYLHIMSYEKETEFNSYDVEQAVKEREERGLGIPYYENKKLTEEQKEIRIILRENRKLLPLTYFSPFSAKNINMEVLLFPFEFDNIRALQKKINRKILEITRNNRILYDSVVIWYDFEELPAMKIVYRSINRINIKKIY